MLASAIGVKNGLAHKLVHIHAIGAGVDVLDVGPRRKFRSIIDRRRVKCRGGVTIAYRAEIAGKSTLETQGKGSRSSFLVLVQIGEVRLVAVPARCGDTRGMATTAVNLCGGEDVVGNEDDSEHSSSEKEAPRSISIVVRYRRCLREISLFFLHVGIVREGAVVIVNSSLSWTPRRIEKVRARFVAGCLGRAVAVAVAVDASDEGFSFSQTLLKSRFHDDGVLPLLFLQDEGCDG